MLVFYLNSSSVSPSLYNLLGNFLGLFRFIIGCSRRKQIVGTFLSARTRAIQISAGIFLNTILFMYTFKGLSYIRENCAC